MYILNIIICNPSYINDYTLWGEYTFEQESRSHFQKVLDQWSSLNEWVLVWLGNKKGPIIYISTYMIGHFTFSDQKSISSLKLITSFWKWLLLKCFLLNGCSRLFKTEKTIEFFLDQNLFAHLYFFRSSANV